MADSYALSGLRPVQEWVNLFRDPASPAYAALSAIYGADRPLLREKAAFVLDMLELFPRLFPGDAPVLLVRSAGRINLIGMHIDHRGGVVNPVAARETWCLCRPRPDDTLDCATPHERLFPRRQFRIQQELGSEKIENWDSWTQAQAAERKAAGTAGDWIHYIKSAALYLEHIRPTLLGAPATPLRGADMLIAGTLPRGAGVSSSSSLVVVVAEALVHINRLPISDREMVEICGQAEWYVGTRGGCGDHAAIKFGKFGRVSNLGSSPLTVDSAPFPEDLRVVLCNSMIEAKKSSGARDEFNNRIASYEFGLLLLRKQRPDLAPKMRLLRDVNCETLGLREADIWRLLLGLPERMTRQEVLAALPGHEERIQHIFGSHAPPARGYPIRQICAFGIAECLRSNLAAKALHSGGAAEFGEIVNISHDGDRVTRIGSSGRREAMDKSMSDELIRARIADLESGDPARAASAALWRIPGGYDASLPELDILVDASLATHGVVAARVVGAGLGGAVHAIVHKDCVDDLLKNVARSYYEPRRLELAAEVYSPVGGSGVFAV
jgi:N-acetylgalactosamine kinase